MHDDDTIGAPGDSIQGYDATGASEQTTLHAKVCTKLRFSKISGGQHKFIRPDGKSLVVNPEEWTECDICYKKRLYTGYRYTGKGSGAQYYTCFLGSEKAQSKEMMWRCKRNRH